MNTPRAKSPLRYFALVFLLSAPIWLLQTQISGTGLPLDVPITDIVAAFIPLFGACLLVSREQGRGAAWNLLQRVFDFRRIKQKRWYAGIILLPVLIFLTIYGTLSVMRAPLPSNWEVMFASIPILLVFFFLGAIGEEVGYMGYAFEPTQKRWGALGAALLIGLPWAVWHYPSMLEQGRSFDWILWGTLGTIAMRVILVWIYNNANACLFACIALHALYNTGRVLFPGSDTLNPLVDNPAVHYSVLIGVAAVIILLWDAKTLTRFRLSRAKI